MTDSETSGGWISLADAAATLGLSIHAVRRRVRQGTLPARRVQTRYGPAWMVQLDGACDARATVASPSRDPDAHPGATVTDEWIAGDLMALVREQQAELLRRTEAATAWQVRAEVLAAQLDQARAELRALQAPHDAPESPIAPHLSADPGEPTTEPSDPRPEPPPPLAPDPLPPKSNGRQPWWRRLVRWAVVR